MKFTLFEICSATFCLRRLNRPLLQIYYQHSRFLCASALDSLFEGCMKFMRHEILLVMLMKVSLPGFDAAYFSRYVISFPPKC